MGKVKQAVTTAAKRSKIRVILSAEPHVNAMKSLRRQGLHSSSSTLQSEIACFSDKRALNPPRFARFFTFYLVLFEIFFVTPGKNQKKCTVDLDNLALMLSIFQVTTTIMQGLKQKCSFCLSVFASRTHRYIYIYIYIYTHTHLHCV